MKRIATVLALIFAAAAHGQVSNPSIVPAASEPVNCPVLPMYYVASGNALYAGNGSNTCQQVNTGGSGTFNALTGDATSTSTGGATTVKGINGTLLSSLASCILYNTTTTGVPSCATAAQAIAALGSTPAINASAMTSFPTFNQSTTGSAAALSISGQTALLAFTGLTSTNRTKTIRDAADTLLELGGSYTPTGTWVWTSASVTWPTFNQNTTGNAGGLTGCTASTAGTICYWTGSAWLALAGNASGTQYLQETSSGVPSWATPSGSGTVTSVSVTTANGVSGTVANPTTTPAITLTLGAITPTSVATGASPPSCTGNSIACFGNQATAITSASGVCSIQDVSNVLDVSCNAATPFTSLANFSTVNLGSSAAGGVTGNLPLANIATQAANSVVMNATAGTAAPAAVAMPTCTTGADLYNTSTNSWSCVSTGGSLPTATTGQTYYYNGTAGAATSAVTINSAGTTGQIGLNNATPATSIDIGGSFEVNSGATPTNASFNGNCIATAVTCAITSGTGLTATGQFIFMPGNGGGVQEIAYGTFSGSTFTFAAPAIGACAGATAGRGCYGTSANTHNNGTNFVAINNLLGEGIANFPPLFTTIGGPFFILPNGTSMNDAGNSGETVNISVPLVLPDSQAILFGQQNTGSGAGGAQGVNSSGVELLVNNNNGNNATLVTDSATPSRNVSTQSIVSTGTFATNATAITAAVTPAYPANATAASNTVHGQLESDCEIFWIQNTALSTGQFGVKLSAAPTSLTVIDTDYNGTTVTSSSPTIITGTTVTATSPAISTTGTFGSTVYWTSMKLIMNPGTANSPTVTLYANSGSASDAVVIQAQTGCTSWH